MFGLLDQRNLIKDYIVFSFLFVCVKTRYSCCALPSPALEGNKSSSCLLTGNHLCIFYLLHKISALWMGRYSLYLLISFFESYFVLVSFSDLSRFIFATWLFIIYSFGKAELHICGLLLLHRHNCFLTLCLADFSEIWQEKNK